MEKVAVKYENKLPTATNSLGGSFTRPISEADFALGWFDFQNI